VKLTTKISIDQLCGASIVWLLNTISLALSSFKQKKEPDNSKIQRITLCKFMGMGSIIESTPLMMTLRANYPEAEITFITLPKNRALISTFPFVDTIVTVDDRSIATLIITFFRMLVAQWMRRIDLFIDLEVHSYFTTILSALCFPAFNIGFYKKESHLHSGIYSAMIYYSPKVPVHAIYLQAAHLLQCNEYCEDLYDWKDHSTDLHEPPLKLFTGADADAAGYIVVNPNASDLRVERRWDQHRYRDLINRILCDYPGTKIILTGSAEEHAYVDTIYRGIYENARGNVLNSSGRLTLMELISLIEGCSMMITNDSGPMHIAFALKKHTIALFGPCSPVAYVASPFVNIIYKDLYCSPCVHDFAISPCKGDNQCMKRITTDEVMNAVRKVLSASCAA
jgi:ADP-heptose:LPS heptosyltransferase